MSQQLKGALYMLYATEKKAFAIFWAILIGILIATMVLVMVVPNTEVRFTLSLPVYIYGIVAGFLVVRGCIPYLIKMGTTRLIISAALGIYGILLALAHAIVSNVITSLSRILFGNTSTLVFSYSSGSSEYFVTHIAELIPNTSLFDRIIIDVTIVFFLFAAAFFISLFFYRFGLVAGIAFIIIGVSLIHISAYTGWLERFFETVFGDEFRFVFFYQLFFAGAIVYVITYAFMHRLTIKT